MLAATFIATIFVPVFFTWFVRKNKSGRAAEPQVLIDNTKQGTETAPEADVTSDKKDA